MMVLIIIAGIAQVLGALAVFGIAKSAVHEILSAILFGFGFLSIALGLVLKELSSLKGLAAQIEDGRIETRRATAATPSPFTREQIPLDAPGARSREFG